MGRLEKKPQKHTHDMSRRVQSDTFLLQQTPHCVQSSSEIEVNDISMLVL